MIWEIRGGSMKVKKLIINMILSVTILLSEVALPVWAEENTNMQATEAISEFAPEESTQDIPNAEEEIEDVGDAGIAGQEPVALEADSLSLSIEYPSDIKCGTPVTFTMNATGGTGNYKYRIAALMDSELKNVYDISFGSNGAYGDSNTFTFTFYASGTYYIRFSVMDMTTYQTKMTGLYEYPIVIQDESYPSVEQIVTTVAAQCEAECSTDFEKALWLHDWIIDHADYDHSYSYCSAEGVLARGEGTCESYHEAYVKLLNKVGIQTGRMEGNVHVWTAVKMDGEWYQIDSTWDDMGDSYKGTYYEHMYFGLTDDIISLVHDEHTGAVPGYESTALENNYFIKTGEIAQWSNPFMDTVKQNIAEGKTEFTLPVTSSMPDSYKNVIYNLVAYQLSKESWDNKKLTVSYGNEQLTCRVEDNETISIQNIEIRNMDNGKGSFDVVLEGISATGDVSEVQVPVWSGSSQDNIYWYTAVKQEDGSYIAQVDIKNHKYDYGEYTVHVYVTTENGVCKFAGQTKTTMEQPYAEVTVQASEDETIYKIIAENVGVQGGVREVRFAVWSEKNGQDDLIWYTATKNATGKYEESVPVANHGTDGLYYAHVYVINNQNERKYVGGTTFTVPSPSVTVLPIASGQYRLTLSGLNAYGDINGVTFAIWGENDGQNDLRWYNASSSSAGKWNVEFPIANHGERGIYYVGAYAQRKDGVNTCLVMTAFRHDESASVQEIEVKNLNASAGTFDVFVKGVTASCGVDSVQIPVWSKEDQSDIVWYTAWRQNDGSYATQVNLKNHNYNYAEYTVHVYVTSKTQVKTYTGAASVVVNEPQISVKTLLSADETRCNLIASNVGVALGLEKVYFAVWSEQGGQDDLCWYQAEQAYAGTWKKEIFIGTHKTPGIYQVHLYGETGDGIRYILGAKTFSVSNVTVQSVEVKNLNPVTGTFDVYIYGIKSPSGVEQVQIPVWSKNDQSDLIWYTAWKQSDGSYATQVNIRNHNNNRGKYTIHTYVIAGNGVRMFTGAAEARLQQ